MTLAMERTQVLIVGAGPAGSVAAAMLRKQGREVVMLEREQFPRFSIGESLLPQSMEYIEAAGLLRDVVEAGFQHKNGATFVRGERQTEFDFRDRFSPGWGTTYQVQRADFDHLLAKGAQRMGADLRFGHEVLAVEPGETPRVTARAPDGREYVIEADFILDASGFARLLPRLLKLEAPSNFPARGAIFTHVQDNIPVGTFDRNKILITTHPEHVDVWYWTIPFSNGCCSLGVVAEKTFLDRYQGSDVERLQAIVGEDPNLTRLLANAKWDVMPVRQIMGYSSNVSSLWGPGYALLGNAGRVPRPGVLLGRDHCLQVGAARVGMPGAQVRGRAGRLGTRLLHPAARRCENVPPLRRVLVRGRLPEDHLPPGAAARRAPHDLLDPGRLCVGHEESLRGRQRSPPGGTGRAVRRLTALLLSAALAACTATPPRAAVPLPELRLAPSALGHDLSLQQQLHFSFGQQQRDLDALLEVDAQEVRLAVQALGQSGVRLSWDGEAPATTTRTVASGVGAWRARARRPAVHAVARRGDQARRCPAPWTLQDEGGVRRLMRDGAVWLQVERQGEGRYLLENRADGYRLQIESAGQEVQAP
jgi:flavin-dependent dehydrogenase